jgi:hypothetical protein
MVKVSSALGEERSAKRGVVSVSFLAETDGLGGLKDKFVFIHPNLFLNHG